MWLNKKCTTFPKKRKKLFFFMLPLLQSFQDFFLADVFRKIFFFFKVLESSHLFVFLVLDIEVVKFFCVI